MSRRKSSKKMFRDAWNPTHEEVVRWAYTPNVFTPDQDFELAVIQNPDLHNLILQCVGDEECPHRYFFLGCLYVLVGDAVRSNWTTFSRAIITNLIKKGQQALDPEIRKWAERAEKLISDPAAYSYDQWGLGSSYISEASQ